MHHPYVCPYIYPCLLSRPRVCRFVAPPQLGSRCYFHLLPLPASTKQRDWESLRIRATGVPGWLRLQRFLGDKRCPVVGGRAQAEPGSVAPMPLAAWECQNSQVWLSWSRSEVRQQPPPLHGGSGGKGTALSPAATSSTASQGLKGGSRGSCPVWGGHGWPFCHRFV